MGSLSIKLLVLALFIQPFALNAADEEQLNYRASYSGFFSVGSQIPIADVVLTTQTVASDADYLETELSVTSAPYDFVESLYPIRYRFRSWYWRDRSASLASEYYEKTKSEKHNLIYLDDPEKDFVTRNLLKSNEIDLLSLQAGDYAEENGLSPTGRLTGSQFDRLGLLQRVRYLNLVPGQELELPVTNGKALMRYRVRVEAAENLLIAGRSQAALKLRFDGMEQDENDHEQHAHRPVFIWLSNDVERVPLKVVSRQALGKFVLELTSPYSPTDSKVAKVNLG